MGKLKIPTGGWLRFKYTWVAVAVCLAGVVLAREPLQHSLFTFLNITKPVPATVLVIEGWLSNKMLGQAAAEFKKGTYKYCLVSGRTRLRQSPVPVLVSYGLDSSSIKFTNAKTGKKHRTYTIALSAWQWLRHNDSMVTSVNLFSAGPHGRKSWIIFKRVFGNQYQVGVISGMVDSTDTDLWWQGSQGTRKMVRFGLGYLYAWVWPFKT